MLMNIDKLDSAYIELGIEISKKQQEFQTAKEAFKYEAQQKINSLKHEYYRLNFNFEINQITQDIERKLGYKAMLIEDDQDNDKISALDAEIELTVASKNELKVRRLELEGRIVNLQSMKVSFEDSELGKKMCSELADLDRKLRNIREKASNFK